MSISVQAPGDSASVDTAARIRIETRRIDGVNTRIRVGGAARSEAVVFVHGFLGSSADFSALLDHVSQFAFVVAPDMPCFGQSERAADFRCTVDGYAMHLQALIAQLGITRVHLVLHDFGGPWGLQWAADHPTMVASLTLFNIGVMPGYRWHPYARAWRTPLVGELMMACMPRALFHRLLQREQPRPLPHAFIDRMFDNIDWGLKRAGLTLYRATPDWGALSVQLGTQLAAQRLPTLVIWGEADRNLPAKYAPHQAAYFAVQEVHQLPACGHWPFIDEPARCSALLCTFLERHLQQAFAEDASASDSR